MTMASGIAKKNGGAPEGARQDQKHMLSVAEAPPKASLLARSGNGKFVTASPDKRAADWLEEQIAASQNEVRSIVVDLTPALARALLNRNPGNRKISQSTVEAYARDIANDAWQFNGEPIIVSRDGHMNDGQHRSEGVVAADKPIRVVMIFGVERETRNTLDQGKVRRLADYLFMDGYSNTIRLASVARYVWQYEQTGAIGNRTVKPTKGECLRVIETYPNLLASIKFVDQKGVSKFVSLPSLAFCHWTFSRMDKAAAEQFIQSIIDGIGLERAAPALYVRSRLIAERGVIRGEAMAELIFKGWNAFRTGETLQRLVISGRLPRLEK